MPINPQVEEALRQAKEELERVKAEKTRLFPPNPYPFAQPDKYPSEYTPEQIQLRNSLNAQIEALEQRIESLQWRLHSK